MNSKEYFEVNCDGLVAPTHIFSGLSHGNLASGNNSGKQSSPRRAALQGLEKMKLLHEQGLKQIILPPPLRPYLRVLEPTIYNGDSNEVLSKLYQNDIKLFKAIFSSSSMWAANAATVSPSLDTEDGKLHLTIANLSSNLHRSLEAETTYQLFSTIFGNSAVIHAPLESQLSDEGAANHLRLSPGYGLQGIEVFVYGRSKHEALIQTQFPRRQCLEASQAIAVQHKLDKQKTIFARQSAEAIDAGVFHNDVISTANEACFIYHEYSFQDTEAVIDEINNKFFQIHNTSLQSIMVKQEELSLAQAVNSYLFNSQIVSIDDGTMLLIAPQESYSSLETRKLIDSWIADPGNPIKHLRYINLNESMSNGGGPACLRLRVVMNHDEYQAVDKRFVFDENKYHALQKLIHNCYPETLCLEDLLKPEFLDQINLVYQELESQLCFQIF